MLKLSQAASHLDYLPFPPWPHFDEIEIAKTAEILASGKVDYSTGDEGRLFEEEFARTIGANYAVALMNGSVALEAALAALDIGEGDEVITTSRTFIASASCAFLRGARPIVAEVNPITQNIAVESIEQLITPKTRAIIVVHFAGWPCEMNDILALANKHGLYVIEDCAQAHGAKYHGKYVGTMGTISAFSFCQDKIITTGGEGGMITTNDATLWERIWAMKDHGKLPQSNNSLSTIKTVGTNWRILEIQSAIGRIQLKKLSSWLAIRQRNASILTNTFNQLDALRLTIPPQNIQHAYYKYYVFVKPDKLKKSWHRDRILKAINDKGVPCFTGGCSEIYLEKAFAKYHLGPKKRYPVAKALGETSLMFLVHPTLTEAHMQFSASVVSEVMQEATASS